MARAALTDPERGYGKLTVEITDDALVVRAALPGVKPEDVDVTDIDAVGRRLEEAHQILVDALESVEKG